MTAVVVCGVDGSPAALDAVRWAARDAARRGADLRLVHACGDLDVDGEPLPGAAQLRAAVRAQGRIWLTAAVRVAEAAAPDVVIDSVLDGAGPVPALLRYADGAVSVVLGGRGLGGVDGMLAGSVALAIVAHAATPVVVVRGGIPDDGPVVVGVDGSVAGSAAIRFAAGHAVRCGAPLVALHAWTELTVGAGVLTADPDRIVEQCRRMLDDQLTACRREHPGLQVEARVIRERPPGALLTAAGAARLVVVGSRGRFGHPGMLLGSTSQALVTHAPCPVAVVRPPED
ncbi:universal stress protein [Amycolatopsis suaedae]|uniref:Universal stress protein n=1 Tax=Amycolatopsis suaedae TaxID=2510978 RepID=A0A4Q7JFG6_9PSEU|nr:universal stress protein [Amycolatopsis suaedae]RZQ65932.1 universal stress protein [Amycolatopsis suaedae]